MKPMVVVLLGFAAIAAASPWGGHGLPVDTPEVAAAKAAHFAAVAKASGHGGWNGAGAWNGGWNGGWNGAGSGAWNGGHDDGQWHDDTHLYDNGHGNWNGAWNGGWNGGWNGHGDDGQWRDDTHQWNNGGWNQWNGNHGDDGDDGQWRDDTHAWADHGQWNHGSGAWSGAGAWSGHGGWAGYGHGAPWAGHGGHLINGETPEVAAARAAHLAAHAAVAHRHRRSLWGVNPNSLPVPADTLHVALAKNAQLIQQHTEGTRNILGGGIPLALPADTHEVAIGKQAHAIAHARQSALTHGHGIAVAPVAVAAVAPVVHSAIVAPAVISTHSSVVHSAPWGHIGHHGLW